MKGEYTVTGSIHEKHGKWYAVLNLKDENGKRVQKWVNTGYAIRGHKKDAEKILSELIVEYDKRPDVYIRNSVADYFAAWIGDDHGDIRPNTMRTYRGNMVNHVIPYFREHDILLQDLRPIDLEDYYRRVLVSSNLSAMTVKHHHQVIGKALEDAVRRGLIYVNPARSARTPKAERYKAEFLNPVEIGDILRLFSGTPIELPITLCAVYGFRRSEVLGLKWGYIDFERKTITVAETLQQHVGGNYTDKPKTDSSYRTLPMTELVFRILSAKKRSQDAQRAVRGKRYHDSDYICTWDTGRPILPNYLSSRFRKVMDEAGYERVRLHDLRHSAASNLLDMGFSVVQVQEWLGHGSAATTLNFYAHADKKSKMEIANALEGLLDIG